MMAQMSVKKCELCTDKCGVFYCYECQHALCDLCRPKHDKIPATRGHTVTEFQNVDLATFNIRSQCASHERELHFYCIKCSDLICRKCVTSTHKKHPFSEIAEMVTKERDHAGKALPELKDKIERISNVKERVKCDNLVKLKTDSTKVIEDIECSYKELTLFIKSKKDIQIIEIEDNEKLECENLESFLQNIGHINKNYSRVTLELENISSEKHDVTFFVCYKTLREDIKNLNNVPEPPKIIKIKRFDKRMFYKEIVDFIQSKVDGSICQPCDEKTLTIEKIHKEQMDLKEKLNGALQRIQTKDDELQILRQQIDSLKSKNEDKEIEKKELVKKNSRKGLLRFLPTRRKEKEQIEEESPNEEAFKAIRQMAKQKAEENSKLSPAEIDEKNKEQMSEKLYRIWKQSQWFLNGIEYDMLRRNEKEKQVRSSSHMSDEEIYEDIYSSFEKEDAYDDEELNSNPEELVEEIDPEKEHEKGDIASNPEVEEIEYEDD